MKKCKKCGKRLWLWNRWHDDKSICWNCGYCSVTEYIAEKYGDEVREEIYAMEERHLGKMGG